MKVWEHPGALLGLLLLLVAPGKPTAGGPQAKVDCICYNEDYVICDWGSQQKPVHNYSFYYWYANISEPSECKDYIQNYSLNVACRFSDSQLFYHLKMYLNDSQGQSVAPPSLLLSTRVRPGRPFNLTLANMSHHQLLLTWETPYKLDQCLEHVVRYKSNKDTEFMEHPITSSLKFQIPSVDPKKRYTFYVKSKVRITCGTTDLWSEESLPAFWGEVSSEQAPLEKQLFPAPEDEDLGASRDLAWTPLAMVAPGKPTAGGPQAKVDCICYNEDYVICDWGSQQKPVHNYSFYYWYVNLSEPSECKDYIQKDSLNVACRFSHSQLFHHLKMYLNDSQGQSVVPPSLLLSTRVRPGRPFNLTLANMSHHQLLLTWKTPYKIDQCLEHVVRYKSNKDTEFMEHPITSSLKFQIPSVDAKKRYTFYVKSKVRIACGTTDLWSEESLPAFWGEEESSPPLLPSSVKTVVIPLACLVLVLMLLALLRMERVWVVLMPRIPNPSKKFEELFTAYQGNFSEWAGVSKDVVETFKPNYYEKVCAITELMPSGGYLSASSEPTAKRGGPLDPLLDPPPKAHPDPAEVTT